MNREIIQKEAVLKAKENKNLLLNFATGVGKTKCFINFQSENADKKTLIVVAERQHIDNWKEEYKKYHKESLLYNTTIICYQSLKKCKDKFFDIICLDEAHHVASELRLNILKNITYNKLILLTATLNDRQFYDIQNIVGPIEKYTVSMSDAIEENILPKPEIVLIPIKMDNVKCDYSYTIKKGFKGKVVEATEQNKFNVLKKYQNVTVKVKTTQQGLYDHINSKLEYWKKRYNQYYEPKAKTMMLKTGLERLRFLADIKTEKVSELLKRIDNLRYLCFCNSVQQANTLSQKYSVHSKIKDPLQLVQQFNDGKINHLFVVNMLQEGTNLNNIQAGVLVQLNREARPFIQKMGRILRSKSPKIFIFYVEASVDETLLQDALTIVNH